MNKNNMKTLEAKLDQILPHRETDGIECDFFDNKPCNCRQRLIKRDILTAVTEWAEEEFTKYYRLPHAPRVGAILDEPSNGICGDCFCEIQEVHTHNQTVLEIKSNLKSTLREKEGK